MRTHEDDFKDFLAAVKEISSVNNLLIDESRNLIMQLEKITEAILVSCKSNLAIHRANAENLEKFFEKLNDKNK